VRLLIVRLSSLGDIVHTLPLALNARMNGAEVGWLTDRRYRGLLDGNPSLARLFLADTHRWRRNPLSPTQWSAIAGLRRELQDFAPDSTLDPQGLWKSALLAKLAGAPVVSFDANVRREPSSALLVATEITPPLETEHVVDQNLSLLAALGLAVTRRAPDARYLLAPEDPDAAAFLRTLPTPFALYHPGAARPDKAWGDRRYAELASRLHAMSGFYPVISWGPGDEARVARLAQALPHAAPIPRVDFRGLAQIMARASLFVAGDTGPVHLADALGVPSLALFGPRAARRNVPERNRPYRGAALSYDRSASIESVACKALELMKSAATMDDLG
jgi:heptosyltransferase-1